MYINENMKNHFQFRITDCGGASDCFVKNIHNVSRHIDDY